MCVGYFCTNCGQCGKSVEKEIPPAENICMNCKADLSNCYGKSCPICGAPIYIPARSKTAIGSSLLKEHGETGN